MCILLIKKRTLGRWVEFLSTKFKGCFAFIWTMKEKLLINIAAKKPARVLTQTPQTLTCSKQLSIYSLICSPIFNQVAAWLIQAVQITKAAGANMYISRWYVGCIYSSKLFKTKNSQVFMLSGETILWKNNSLMVDPDSSEACTMLLWWLQILAW